MPASPFQASGETSPGKNDDLPRTIAGSTPLPLGRRSFAVSGPLAPVRSASYPVPVRRLTGSFHASFSVRLTTNALRFPSVPATRFREDFHLQVIAHAGPTTVDLGIAAQGLLLAYLVGLGLFVLIGGGGDRWPVRYLVPLWPAISVLAALAVAKWRPAIRPAAALVTLPAVFTLFADRSWPRGADGDRPREEALAVGSAVEDSGARAVWADYWDVYRMALLAGESPPWVTLRIIERRPDWVREARSASPVAYLLRPGDAEVRDRLRDAEERGAIRRISTQDVGPFELVVTDRSAADLVLMNSSPSRTKQRVAALAGGLLFLGTLVALGLFTSGSRTSPGLEN